MDCTVDLFEFADHAFEGNGWAAWFVKWQYAMSGVHSLNFHHSVDDGCILGPVDYGR